MAPRSAGMPIKLMVVPGDKNDWSTFCPSTNKCAKHFCAEASERAVIWYGVTGQSCVSPDGSSKGTLYEVASANGIA